MIVDDLITVSNSKFKYKDPEELRDYYQKALDEDRLIYLWNDNKIVGYIIYYIFDKDSLDKYLSSDNGKLPEHKSNEKYLYIDENVVFTGKRANYLPLRKQFKTMYPQLKEVYWHNIITKEGRRKKRIFKYSEVQNY